MRVALLTSGDVIRWDPKEKPYLDPRATTVPLNTYFAKGMQLNGLSVWDKELLANTSLIDFIKSHNLSVYIWGAQMNNTKVIQILLEHGADGLIFDNLDKVLAKKDQENFEEQSE